MQTRFNSGKLVLILLFALPVLNSLPLILILSAAAARQPSAEHNRLTNELAEIRKELPDHGIVGYVTEPEIERHERDKGLHNSPLPQFDSTARFLLIQYELAPIVLKPGKDAPVVIGDFYINGKLPADSQFLVQKDFHNGFFLLK